MKEKQYTQRERKTLIHSTLHGWWDWSIVQTEIEFGDHEFMIVDIKKMVMPDEHMQPIKTIIYYLIAF